LQRWPGRDRPRGLGSGHVCRRWPSWQFVDVAKGQITSVLDLGSELYRDTEGTKPNNLLGIAVRIVVPILFWPFPIANIFRPVLSLRHTVDSGWFAGQTRNNPEMPAKFGLSATSLKFPITSFRGNFSSRTAATSPSLNDVSQEQSLVQMSQKFPMPRPCSNRLAENCPVATVSQRLPSSA